MDTLTLIGDGPLPDDVADRIRQAAPGSMIQIKTGPLVKSAGMKNPFALGAGWLSFEVFPGQVALYLTTQPALGFEIIVQGAGINAAPAVVAAVNYSPTDPTNQRVAHAFAI